MHPKVARSSYQVARLAAMAKAVNDQLNLIAEVDAVVGLWKTEEEIRLGLLRVKEAARDEEFPIRVTNDRVQGCPSRVP